MEHRGLARFCFWVLFYAATLLASLAVMGVLSLMISLPTWKLVAISSDLEEYSTFKSANF